MANCSIKTIWGIAKSPELQLSEDELYIIISRETKKDSMRKLTQGEVNNICRVLLNMKDSVAKKEQRRTDTHGNAQTETMRKKVYILTGELGWNNDNSRINGFVKRMFGVDYIGWLTPEQCTKLIEILKKMIARGKDNGF